MDQQQVAESAKPATRMKFPDKPPPETHREYLDMDTDEEEFGHQETPEPIDEAPPEPEKPQFSTEELDRLVELTKRLTLLADLSADCWNERCLETIRQFFREPTQLVLTLFFWNKKLVAWLGFPRSTDSGLTYFLRKAWQVYRLDNFLSTVSFGSVCERTELAMLRFVEGLYAPLAFKKSNWPGIKKDQILSNLNEFLTRAIDLTYRPMGMLLLYVPWEGTQPRCAAISREEEAQLLGRLDKVACTWIKQIREVLVKSPILHQELHDLTGEFDFWQSRYENLACIAEQLTSARVQSIVQQLKKIKSPSVKQLKLLAGQVDKALGEAKSNLIFLHLVLDSCQEFSQPKQIQACLPRILLVIKFVWTESPYYHSLSNIERLLCSLSVHVVKICINNVEVNLIFDDSKKCKEMLKINLQCCHYYAEIYENMLSSCMQEEPTWKVDQHNVFKSIKAFEQRCHDVLEICDAILIYGGMNKINFGGTKGNCHEMQYNHVKDYFVHIKNDMRICCDYALDITSIQWFRVMSNFRSNVNKLESTIKHMFINLFEEVKNVDMGIESLYTLFQFKERKGFQDMLHDEWTKVWEMYYQEIKLCLLYSLGHQIIPDKVTLSQSEESMIKDIYNNYLLRLRKIMINASDWLGDCDIQHEMLSKYS